MYSNDQLTSEASKGGPGSVVSGSSAGGGANSLRIGD